MDYQNKMNSRTTIRSNNMPSSIKNSSENPFKTVPRSRARKMARAAAELAIKIKTDPDEIKTPETFSVEMTPAPSATRIRRCARAKRVTGINPFTEGVKEKVEVRVTQVFNCPRRMQQRERELSRRKDRAWKSGTAADRPSDKRAEFEGAYFSTAMEFKKEALHNVDFFHYDWYNSWDDGWDQTPSPVISADYLKEKAEIEACDPTKFLPRKHFRRGMSIY